MSAKRRRGRGRTMGIGLIVIVFIAVMAVQIYRIKQKDNEYAAREQELMREYQEETERAAELDELEEYMNSAAYIEDLAKSKLGLTYENEIIFKELENE